MAKMSVEKGKRFERLLASKFREYGYDAKRTAQHCGKTGEAADVIGLPHIHIEAKHVERLNLHEAMDQAKRDAAAAKNGAMPVVFHKKNNCEILVTMRFDDFMRIYREFEAGTEGQDEQDT